MRLLLSSVTCLLPRLPPVRCLMMTSFDGDDYKDLFVNNWDGGNVLYLHNDWNGLTFSFSPEIMPVASGYSGAYACMFVEAADMDQDGGW